jgi:hypothetical protein
MHGASASHSRARMRSCSDFVMQIQRVGPGCGCQALVCFADSGLREVPSGPPGDQKRREFMLSLSIQIPLPPRVNRESSWVSKARLRVRERDKRLELVTARFALPQMLYAVPIQIS